MTDVPIKRKCYMYLRRSQDRTDRQVLSLEAQRHELEIMIERYNLDPIWISPESRSAHEIGRPYFGEMMKGIESGAVKYIATWEASRLARNALDGGTIIHMMQTGRISEIFTGSKVYHADSAEDQFMLQLEFGMSKMSSDKLSRDVKRGNRAKYERREYPTYAITGYLNVKVGSSRSVIHDQDRAPQLIKVCEMAGTGKYTFDEVFQEAQKLGLKSRGSSYLIRRSTLWDLLHNKTLAGYYTHGPSGEIKGDFEPLISLELWKHVQSGMGWHVKPIIRNSTSGQFYPFKGPLVCGTCGHNITAYTKRKKLRKTGETVDYVFYTCTKKSKHIKCKEQQISQDELQKQISKELSRIRISKKDAKACFDMLRKYHKEITDNRNSMRETWDKDRKEARIKMDSLLEMRMNNEINADQFLQYKSRYEETEARTSQLLNDSNQSASTWLEHAERFFSKAVKLVDTFELATDEEKRALLINIGSNWTLSNKKVRLTPRESLSTY